MKTKCSVLFGRAAVCVALNAWVVSLIGSVAHKGVGAGVAPLARQGIPRQNGGWLDRPDYWRFLGRSNRRKIQDNYACGENASIQ